MQVFREGDLKRFELSELKGKTVDIVSIGMVGDKPLMYMRDIHEGNIYVVELDSVEDEEYKDCIVKDFDNVDFTEIKCAMIVIYDHPKDYPNKYVARVWDMNKPTNVVAINERLDILRTLIPGGMIVCDRNKDDDPCILEVWL